MRIIIFISILYLCIAFTTATTNKFFDLEDDIAAGMKHEHKCNHDEFIHDYYTNKAQTKLEQEQEYLATTGKAWNPKEAKAFRIDYKEFYEESELSEARGLEKYRNKALRKYYLSAPWESIRVTFDYAASFHNYPQATQDYVKN